MTMHRRQSWKPRSSTPGRRPSGATCTSCSPSRAGPIAWRMLRAVMAAKAACRRPGQTLRRPLEPRHSRRRSGRRRGLVRRTVPVARCAVGNRHRRRAGTRRPTRATAWKRPPAPPATSSSAKRPSGSVPGSSPSPTRPTIRSKPCSTGFSAGPASRDSPECRACGRFRPPCMLVRPLLGVRRQRRRCDYLAEIGQDYPRRFHERRSPISPAIGCATTCCRCLRAEFNSDVDAALVAAGTSGGRSTAADRALAPRNWFVAAVTSVAGQASDSTAGNLRPNRRSWSARPASWPGPPPAGRCRTWASTQWQQLQDSLIATAVSRPFESAQGNVGRTQWRPPGNLPVDVDCASLSIRRKLSCRARVALSTIRRPKLRCDSRLRLSCACKRDAACRLALECDAHDCHCTQPAAPRRTPRHFHPLRQLLLVAVPVGTRPGGRWLRSWAAAISTCGSTMKSAGTSNSSSPITTPSSIVDVGSARFEQGQGIFINNLSLAEPRAGGRPQPRALDRRVVPGLRRGDWTN